MKIFCTSDWHIGNMFHGNDRLPEHRHFLEWLLEQIKEEQPDALLVAGDVFDNGNPSAAAQTAYYEFLADATQLCPTMQVVITAGNHDSASRLEAPRPLLARHKVEIRGNVQRTWTIDEQGGRWVNNYDDLIIPVVTAKGEQFIILAVPHLRSDAVHPYGYSQGVNIFLSELTAVARERYPHSPLVMMAHMYAKGADIALRDASEKIVIGGQEEVNMEGWTAHPDYLTCGHIHKRQPIWNTRWARYTGSILPMSFAEVHYKHGIDKLTWTPEQGMQVNFMEYTPQHALCILPEDEGDYTYAEMKRLINRTLRPRDKEGKLSSHFDYVMLKVNLDYAKTENLQKLEELLAEKDAVLCKIQKIMPTLGVTTFNGERSITSVDDIINRNPLDTLKETFVLKHKHAMSEHQEAMLNELIQEMGQTVND